MLAEPEKYIEAFAKAGADLITVHAEAAGSLERMRTLAAQIHSLGIRAGISLKPARRQKRCGAFCLILS